MIRNILLATCLIFGLSQSTIAQEQWTLQECVNEALKNSLEIEQSKLGVAFSDIDLQQAKHNRYPTLSASTSLGTNFGRFVNPITDQFINQSLLSNSVNVSSGVAIFNGFQITNSLKQAKINKNAAEYDVSQQERDIALMVANTYLNALFAEENYKIAKVQYDVTTEQLERTRTLINSGSLAANEILTVEAQLATNEQALITSENSKTIALLNLKQLMRLDASEEISVIRPEDVVVYSDPDVLTFQEVYGQAYQNQPNVKAAELRRKSAEYGVQIAQGGLMPSVSGFAGAGSNYASLLNPPAGAPDQKGYSTQLDENLSFNVGVSVQMPIYQNYSNRLNIQRAKLNVKQVENTNAVLDNTLSVTVQQALVDAKAAKRKLEAADKTVLAQKANYDNAQKRAELGSINSFELTTLQNNYTEAQISAVLAKYEYVFSMKVLDFYMGKPLSLN